jgi:hypothetical protein
MYLNWLSPYSSSEKILDIESSFTGWSMPFSPHWQIGGVALLVIVAALVGIVVMVGYGIARPAFFRGEVLNANTPTLVPEATGVPVGTPPHVGRDDVPPNAPLVPPAS